ncbi:MULTISPECIES: antibiotic biosynthesis monooxygenase [Pseudoalteromonas]|uniref:antibiotic biosynthesis monooxygenase family protein n=1 Tax=Pseudoalteromonas TaxID=53246 RepID=UPI000FFE65A8|nr:MULTISPECIES: antibiotic biosynthesis monooxygenase [Pseudoalteromonas]MCG9760162.1 antibiotic biosynthesis monooxygenase [Pseudoalteromonas sp. Isolate6]NKC21368.1 antibiotic biosynthesis monooxygenase [Pseudoalteromonas galatheae]RXE85877.1 antibiotic biosynthesis monooxygenase [Pseudoalteromonas sp. A757]
MLAVIFEVTPKEQGKALYFEIAQALKSTLNEVDGFISVERFQSLSNQDKFLSLSFWQNETALKQWKEHFEHQVAQKKGKEELFSHFRIRVGYVIRDYGSENQVTK